MPLTPGSRIGSYEVVSPLGAGGMGEVYRARDSRLHRDIAIKVLPSSVSADADRLARFSREAQTLAALNHANIATIHGIEEFEGGRALVMELVEGDDLSTLIARGPIPLEDARPIARQIAEALEVAHELGIIHRDLKPANVKVRTDGTVKVLDFGLAKALDPTASARGDVNDSPTLTAHATALGIVIGTAAYMAPEQARGRTVDKRADIWAFGVVLYEMLTGGRLFVGDDASDILAAVLRQPIDWAALPADTPDRVRRLLERCLDRDVKQRLRDIGEARLALTGGDEPEAADAAAVPRPASRRSAAPWLLACAGCLLAGAAAAWFVVRAPSLRPSALRLSVTPPRASVDHAIRVVHISPDGRRIVYSDDASPVLLVRDLADFESRPLPGTEGGRLPFFSPDGAWVGFYADGKLRKVAVNGGDPVSICNAATDSPGANWGRDGTIYFSPTWTAGLWKVSSAGGEPVQVTTPNRSKGEAAHFWPRVLPDGRRVLFTIFGGQGLADAKIGLLDVASGRVDVLLQGARPVYLGTGHVVFFHIGGYYAVPFDATTGTVTGEPRGIGEKVRPLDPTGAPENYFDAAQNGRLVYVPGGASRNAPYSRLVWIDRQGRMDVLPFADYHYTLALAPDQRHAAVARSAAGDIQIWIYDLERGTRDQLTRDGTNFDPVWSPSGDRVAYTSLTKTNGGFDLRWSPADGSRPPQVLLATGQDELKWTWLPDGRSGLLDTIAPLTGKDIHAFTEGAPSTRPLIATAIEEDFGEVSPDGRFVLWVSGSTLYAARYPDLTGRVQLAARASTPHWSAGRGEIVYVQDGRMCALPYRVSAAGLAPGTPVSLFPIPRGPMDLRYGVSRDGQRFLMLQNDPSRETTEEIRVIDDGYAVLRDGGEPMQTTRP